MTVAVAIVAKAPRPGAVKTRLCPPLQPREAAALSRCFLRDKIAQVRGLSGVTPVIAYAPVLETTLGRARADGLRSALVDTPHAAPVTSRFLARHAGRLDADRAR